MKLYKVREFEKILKNNGYVAVRRNGSHQVWKNGTNTISVPMTKLVNVIARRLIKENNLQI